MAIKEKLADMNEGRWGDMVASMGKPGYAGGKGAARDNLRKNHPNATTTTDSDKVDSALAFAKNNWKAGTGIAAGLGALLLAKKLRAKKKAAAKKAKA